MFCKSCYDDRIMSADTIGLVLMIDSLDLTAEQTLIAQVVAVVSTNGGMQGISGLEVDWPVFLAALKDVHWPAG
jgi:hypothetical protein